MSKLADATLFHIGLATPMSSVVQILMCVIFMVYTSRSAKGKTL